MGRITCRKGVCRMCMTEAYLNEWGVKLESECVV